eukprot:EG_transcript_23469
MEIMTPAGASILFNSNGIATVSWEGECMEVTDIWHLMSHVNALLREASGVDESTSCALSFTWQFFVTHQLPKLFFSKEGNPLHDGYWMENEMVVKRSFKAARAGVTVDIHPFGNRQLHWWVTDPKTEGPSYLGSLRWSKDIDERRRSTYFYTLTTGTLDNAIHMSQAVKKWLTWIYKTETERNVEIVRELRASEKKERRALYAESAMLSDRKRRRG